MEIDRRAFFATLGGAAAISAMDSEARADALEEYMSEQLDNGAAGSTPTTSPDKNFPTVAELDAQITTRDYRRGVGTLFANNGRNVKKLEPLPANPTLLDFFKYRFAPANHVLQSATRAMKTGMTEEIILACLLHDVVQSLIKPDHGWWGAQLFEPYISPKATFAIRYHQALRFYPEFPEASALLELVRAREAAPPAPAVPAAPAAPRVERLRLPGTGRALIIGRTDGGLIASQPLTDDAKDISEALARMLQVATAALRRAALGPLHRAIVEDRRDAVFTRTDGELIVSLALPRATDPTQGLLDVNRLWSATRHELGLAAGPPAAAPSSTPADTPGAAPTRRIS